MENDICTRRSLLFITGTRADFGKLEPLAIAARNSGHSVAFFVTGMHMLERYGLTKLEVRRMEGVMVHEFLNQHLRDPQDIIFAKTVMGFSDFVMEHRPDLVVIHGDRTEAFACALVCATNYIRSAHIEGGEVSGTIDEIFRHCNTKLATHHFVSSEEAKRRVMAMGEPEDRVYVIGSPEIDFHATPSGVSIEEVISHYDIPFSEFGIAVFHPVTSEADSIGQQANDLFSILEESGRNFVVIAPNNDPGCDSIFKVLRRLPRTRFHLLPSMRFAHFSELMKNAACMLGNSSAGVREAPFLGMPSLDIGTRQTNRARATSLFGAEAVEREAIQRFLKREWGKRYPPHYAFGVGHAAKLFVEKINGVNFWSTGLQKTFKDHV